MRFEDALISIKFQNGLCSALSAFYTILQIILKLCTASRKTLHYDVISEPLAF